MKNRIWYILPLCLLYVFSLHARDYETVEGDLMKARIYTLDNGMKVYMSVNKEKPRLQTYIAVRTGSKNDPAETTGLAHYLEHLLFKGSTHFGTSDAAAERPYLDKITALYEEYRTLSDPAARKLKYHEIDSISQLAAQYNIPNEYDKMMAFIGARGTNAHTWLDETIYKEDIPSNELERWLMIESDRFQNMVIRGFHTELEAVYEEYNLNLTADVNKVLDAMLNKLYPTHPYGTQNTIGTQAHLKNPSIVNIQNYFDKWYVPANMAICLAGDFDPDEAIRLVDKYFGQWRKGGSVSQPVFPVQKPLTADLDTTVVGQEAEQVWVAWQAKNASSLSIDTLTVIDHMLSNGKAGLFDLDLNQKMRVLGSSGGLLAFKDYSAFYLVGMPNHGQSLKEVRQLMLDEIGKLCRGEFSDDLLQSVISNLKLSEHTAIESNQSRATAFYKAFINETPWEQEAHRLDRLSKLTKKDIMEFASRFFSAHNASIYKITGEDSTQKKIDKPQITAIPTNRDMVSSFVSNIQKMKVEPIQPRFVDFNRDMLKGSTAGKLPLLYVRNTENGRFQLYFYYKFGSEACLPLYYASDYLGYVGTDKLTAEQVQQQFYKLACKMHVAVSDRTITVMLSGLSENMGEALRLMDEVMNHAKGNRQSWDSYVGQVIKNRADKKLEQEQNFAALSDYGKYGRYNSTRNIILEEQLRKQDPQQLLDMLKSLSGYEQTVLYYGPLSEKELSKAIASAYKTPKKLKPVPENKHYVLQTTPENEVLIAPYKAKNIYMTMYNDEENLVNVEETPIQELFNAYFGGGMNSIVFQEMREARGLAYSAWAYYFQPSYKDMKEYFQANIITQNDKMMDCVRQFRAILDTIPQSQAAFDITKDALMKRLASARTTRFNIINSWLEAEALGIDYDISEKVYRDVPALTLDDLITFGKKKISHRNFRYIILGDEAELDMESLGRIGPIKRVSTEEIFGY